MNAKEFVKEGIKNTIGENIEELGIENTAQALANNHFNNKKGLDPRDADEVPATIPTIFESSSASLGSKPFLMASLYTSRFVC